MDMEMSFVTMCRVQHTVNSGSVTTLSALQCSTAYCQTHARCQSSATERNAAWSAKNAGVLSAGVELNNVWIIYSGKVQETTTSL